ncbi:hypothetical protein VUR80DRAFT_8682 [Thermomyces stellatus]
MRLEGIRSHVRREQQYFAVRRGFWQFALIMYHFVMRQARGRAGNIGCGVIHQGPWKAFSHRRRWHEGFAANGGICRVKRWATRVLMATNLDCEVASATVDYANVHLKQRYEMGEMSVVAASIAGAQY